jgi:hypothetical protein
VVLIVAIMPVGSAMAQPNRVTAEAVRRAIDAGVNYLRQQQNRANGTWPEMAEYEGGVTALCTLAL